MVKDIDPVLKDALKVIGVKIRQLRKGQTNLNYKDFADQLQEEGVMVSKNTLQRIESGNENYNLLSLLSLLKYFDIQISDFFQEAGL